jgi:hypothetical protein
MPLTNTERAYLAGIVDGEGSIMVQRSMSRSSGNHYFPVIKVANTDRNLIDWLKSNVNDKTAGYRSRLHEGCKDVYHWIIASNEAIALLKTIRPYLVVKGQQADVVLAMHDENRAWLKRMRRKNWGNYHPVPPAHRKFREACYLYVRDLNQRGPGEPKNGSQVRKLIREIELLESSHASQARFIASDHQSEYQ